MNKGNQKGITLIALIITIIVMLILVAVTVRTAVNSGLFGHAKNATEQWAKEEKRESNIGADIDDVVNEYTSEQTIVRSGMWRAKKNTEELSTSIYIEVYSTYRQEILNSNEYKEKYIVNGINEIINKLGETNRINSLEELLPISDDMQDGEREMYAMMVFVALASLDSENNFNEEQANTFLEGVNYLIPANFAELEQEEQIKIAKEVYADIGLHALGYTKENIAQIEQEYEKYKQNETKIEIPDEIKNKTYTITYPDGSTKTILGKELGSFKDRYKVTSGGDNIIKVVSTDENHTLAVSVDNYIAGTYKAGDYTYTFSNVLGGYGAKVTDNTLSSYEKPKSNINGVPVVSWNGMFRDCKNLTTFSFKGVDSSKVTDMKNLFYGCSNLNSVDFANINTSNVTDMSDMFALCYSIENIGLTNLNTAKVTKMNSMFYSCHKVNQLDLSSFNTSLVTDMSNMFINCYKLQRLDLSNFNTENVKYMDSMFRCCNELESINISSFNTSKVTDMHWMFSNCKALKNLNLSNFDTSSLKRMGYRVESDRYERGYFNTGMFEECVNLEELDLSSFDTSKVTEMRGVFEDCPKLTTIYVGDGWTTENADTTDMFLNCGTNSVTKK